MEIFFFVIALIIGLIQGLFLPEAIRVGVRLRLFFYERICWPERANILLLILIFSFFLGILTQTFILLFPAVILKFFLNLQEIPPKFYLPIFILQYTSLFLIGAPLRGKLAKYKN
ncbi:MAG: hypothetical protein COS84_01010 [Armatimonadetes bacterium CG07_land_8_20_14_0_80_40_9]|nr:MAG: hypothetical protein COS84_01010 [Armatimonadetes bacterium CG07_land_8_20_14_0_80_40_9]